jgi:hypothetical protein
MDLEEQTNKYPTVDQKTSGPTTQPNQRQEGGGEARQEEEENMLKSNTPAGRR